MMTQFTSQQTLARGDWQYLLPDVSILGLRMNQSIAMFMILLMMITVWMQFLTFDYFYPTNQPLTLSKQLDDDDNNHPHHCHHNHHHHYHRHRHHCSISSTISWDGSTQTLSLPYFLSSSRFTISTAIDNIHNLHSKKYCLKSEFVPSHPNQPMQCLERKFC